MTEFWLVWVSYSLATAIYSLWRLYAPIYTQLPEDHLLVRHKYISLTIWVTLTSLLAPIIVPALIIEEYRQAYIDGFVLGSKDA